MTLSAHTRKELSCLFVVNVDIIQYVVFPRLSGNGGHGFLNTGDTHLQKGSMLEYDTIRA